MASPVAKCGADEADEPEVGFTRYGLCCCYEFWVSGGYLERQVIASTASVA